MEQTAVNQDYTVHKEIGDEYNAWSVVKPDGEALISGLDLTEKQARRIMQMLNSSQRVVIYEWKRADEGAIVLSELDRKDYELVSHTAVISEGGTIWHTAILRKKPAPLFSDIYGRY